MHETSSAWSLIPACAAFLHDLSTVVAGQLAKSIITVNDGPVYDLGISQHKVCVCGKSTGGYGEEAGERNQAQGQKVNSKKTRGRSLYGNVTWGRMGGHCHGSRKPLIWHVYGNTEFQLHFYYSVPKMVKHSSFTLYSHITIRPHSN